MRQADLPDAFRTVLLGEVNFFWRNSDFLLDANNWSGSVEKQFSEPLCKYC